MLKEKWIQNVFFILIWELKKNPYLVRRRPKSKIDKTLKSSPLLRLCTFLII